MSLAVWRFRRYLVAAVGLVGGPCRRHDEPGPVLPGKWWHGYGNGADNSRYFASKQINKSNVNQLQVAWSYPHGETVSVRLSRAA